MLDWHIVAQPCENGGLGVTNLSDMNVALLAKWVYRYVNDINQLCVLRVVPIRVKCFQILINLAKVQFSLIELAL